MTSVCIYGPSVFFFHVFVILLFQTFIIHFSTFTYVTLCLLIIMTILCTTHVCGIVHDNKMVFIRWKCMRVKASKRTKVKNSCNKTCMWHVLLCVLYHFESCLYINVQKTGKKKVNIFYTNYACISSLS